MKRLLIPLTFFLASSIGSASEHLLVPIEAYELAKTHGCSIVADYFDNRPAAENPPYALIAGDYGKMQIAVWCTTDSTKAETQRSYTLLLRVDDASNPLSRCPREIHSIKGIGGLSFVEVSEKAELFHFVDGYTQLAKSGTVHTTGLLSSYDGLETYYICVGGRWAFRSLD